MRSIIFSLFLLFFLSSVSHAAKIDTSFTFSTIETEHFSIHFHQGLEPAARKASVIAEEVHRKLVPELQWQPREKTQLVLIDDSDFTNGFAITIPYNTIYVQCVPPSVFSTLGEYDDWLKDVITHEYSHILTSDPSRGYWKVTRSIFGKPLPWLGDPFTELMFIVTAPPNTFMPRWWHEGDATWSESQFTGWGRGKGSFYDMVFRTAVADNHLPRVDEINGDVPYWPDGNLPYMFGYRLQKYIADTYGNDAIGKLSIAQSGRFPYFLSAPAEELSGKSYRDLYDDMIAALRKEQGQKIAVLSSAPFTPLTTVSKEGENLTHPRYSPDGSRIAFTRRDPHDHTMVVITDRSGKRIADFRRRYSDGNLSWSPDGRSLYFTQAEINRGFDTYQDLYVYDVPRDSVTRLTYGKRLSEADISPDGKLFAAVVSYRGSQNLAILDVDAARKKKATPRLVTDYSLQRVSSPHWSPDGKTICYSVRDNTGHTTIRTYELASGKDQPLFTVDNTVEYPIWSRDGSSIFYISDETGVFNLFAYDLKEGKSYQVSHLLGGALQPDPSPDGRSVAVTSYSSRGFYVAEMALDRTRWSEKRGPSIPLSRNLPVKSEPTAGASVPAAQTESVKSVAAGQGGTAESTPAGQTATDERSAAQPAGNAPSEPATLPVSRYNVLKTVYPHFWLPRLSDDGSDQTVVGAFTAGSDVLSYNSYTLATDYSPGRKKVYFNLAYDNDYFYPTLSLRAHMQPYLYSDLKQKGDYYERNLGVTLQASVPINFLERRYTFTAGYQLLDQKALSDLDRDGNFNGAAVFQGRRDNFFAGVAFDNLLIYPYSISFEEGRSISFLYRRFAKEIGSDINLSEYTAEYREYLRLPTQALKHHVLYLKLAGGFADGDLQYGQQSFQVGGIPSYENPYSLRGYPDRFITGEYVATGTLEYRAPIFNPMRGPGTAPIFAQKVHGAIFVDAGEVWDRQHDFNADKLKIGAGIEARADITIGYWLTVTPAVGFAHGFNSGGENQIYLTVYSSL